jgi:hypothetical protein
VIIDGRLLQDAEQMKLYVASAKHIIAESWRLITPTAIKNCSVKCCFLIKHVSSNDNNAVKLDEEDGWHSVQHLRVHSEDCPKCDCALKACGVWNVNQVLDQHSARPEEEPEKEEEVTEHKATFLDALKGLEAAKKHIYQFDTENTIILMCKKLKMNYTD